jgi:hypothetical protein
MWPPTKSQVALEVAIKRVQRLERNGSRGPRMGGSWSSVKIVETA